MTKKHDSNAHRWCGVAIVAATTIGMTTPAAMSAATISQLTFANASSAQVYAVSANGSVAAGRGTDNVNFVQSAYSWTNGTATDLGASTFSYSWGPAPAEIRGISGDGTVFAGFQTGSSSSEAFVQTSAGRTVITAGSAYGVSGNGQVVVGDRITPSGRQAFSWTSSGGVTDLSTSALSGTVSDSYASNTNADGTVVVGRAFIGSNTVGVRWVNGVAQDIGGLGGTYSNAVAVSGDGSVVAGNSDTAAAERRGFRWENGTMTMLTTLGGAGTLGGSTANVWGMSGDGSIIVGESGQSGTSTTAAFLWTQALGMVNLNTYLTSLGVNLTGWELTHAHAISSDGSTIVGIGRLNGSAGKAWSITGLNFSAVPGSGLAAVGSLGLAGLARRRRR